MKFGFINFQAKVVVPDDAIVGQLLEMGFSVEGCKKAAFHTNNSGYLEPQLNITQHKVTWHNNAQPNFI